MSMDSRGTDESPRADSAGRIETHGTDHIPAADRHGHPRQLFSLWAAANITYLYVVLGGLMILLGLNVWQSFAVLLAGNVFWIAIGFVAISGPAAGLPSEVITRAMYGIRGNRVYTLVTGWLIGVAYEAINLATGSLAGFALVQRFAGHVPFGAKVAIIVGTAAVTFTIAVLGHATIVRLSGYFSVALFVALAVLGWFVVRHADFGYRPPASAAVHGWALWAVAFVCFAIIASSPLSWGSSPDFSRYLAAETPARAVVVWTFLGSFVPSVLLTGIGVLAATAVDMTDPQTSLAAILPDWFYIVFLAMVVLGLITNNVLTAYSTGLALQAAGLRWRRSATVVFDAVVALGVTAYALFVSNFLDTVSTILTLTVALLGPAIAVYAVDVVLRRNRYDHRDLTNETRSGPFWYRGGWHLPGIVALVIGTTCAALCVNTDVYVGPIATLASGADFSALVGPAIAAVIYWRSTRIRTAHDGRITPVLETVAPTLVVAETVGR